MKGRPEGLGEVIGGREKYKSHGVGQYFFNRTSHSQIQIQSKR